MPVSHDHGLIFVHIPKTGGSSITKAIGVYGRKSIRSAFGSRRQHYTMSQLLGMGCITTKERFEYFKFSFVRNPFDRMVSIFRYMVRAKEEKIRNFNKAIRYHVNSMKKGREKRVFYFRPQSEYLFSEGEMIVDFIGRFEHLKRDFRKVARRVGISGSLPHLKRSKARNYRSYYNRASKDLVKRFYAEDLDKFKYKF